LTVGASVREEVESLAVIWQGTTMPIKNAHEAASLATSTRTISRTAERPPTGTMSRPGVSSNVHYDLGKIRFFKITIAYLWQWTFRFLIDSMAARAILRQTQFLYFWQRPHPA
jgi:hypothetical protein